MFATAVESWTFFFREGVIKVEVDRRGCCALLIKGSIGQPCKPIEIAYSNLRAGKGWIAR